MRSNSLLTYVLYALLAGLIIVAGYKACQMRQDSAQRQKENAELDQVMRDLGYSDDTTAAGSSYVGGDSLGSTAGRSATPSKQPPATSPSGIENDDPAPQTQPRNDNPTTVVTKPVTTKSPDLAGKPPVNKGRYGVITGSFSSVDNARDEMETLVKAGYRNAEVRKFPNKAWVIALRTNDRAAAERAAEKLKYEGYPAAYVKTL